jgi:hypothetical protein
VFAPVISSPGFAIVREPINAHFAMPATPIRSTIQCYFAN